MKISSYNITSKDLLPYIQYILFSHSSNPSNKKCITAFANNNFCLGILNGKKMQQPNNGTIHMIPNRGITFYFSGMYMKPCDFLSDGIQDEICIDFTPAGFHYFFPFKAKTFMIGDNPDDVLGKGCNFFFESIFSEPDFSKRGALIEKFLLQKLRSYQNPFLAETLSYFDSSFGETKLHEVSKKMKCSEKKIYRFFTDYFDISPKDYLRIIRFRKVLWNLHHYRSYSFNQLTDGVNYFDQSHLIREFNFFTGKSPSKFSTNFECVDNKIIFEMR